MIISDPPLWGAVQRHVSHNHTYLSHINMLKQLYEFTRGGFTPFSDRLRVASASVGVALFAAVGVMVCFTTPPFQLPDEPVHWLGGYQRIESVFGVLRGGGKDCYPAAALDESFSIHKMAFRPSEKLPNGSFERALTAGPSCKKADLRYGGLLTYPGLLLARVLIQRENGDAGQSLMVFYLTRLLHGILIAGCLVRLASLLRGARWQKSTGALIIFPFCLSPLFVQQSFAVSADVICNAAAILLVAYMSSWKQLTKVDLVFTAVITATSVLTKPTMLPLVVAALACPILIDRFCQQETLETPRARRMTWRELNTLVFLVALVALSVYAITQLGEVPESFRAGGRDLSINRQVEFIIHNPIKSLAIMARAIIPFLNLTPYTERLGWGDTVLASGTRTSWESLLWLFLGLEALILLREGRKILAHSYRLNLSMMKGVLVWSGALCCVYASALVTAAFLYMDYTPVGADTVIGLQARYFFPQIFIGIGCISGIINSLTTPFWKEADAPEAAMPMMAVAGWSALLGFVGIIFMSSLYIDIARRFF